MWYDTPVINWDKNTALELPANKVGKVREAISESDSRSCTRIVRLRNLRGIEHDSG